MIIGERYAVPEVDLMTELPSPFRLRGEELESLVLFEFGELKKSQNHLWDYLTRPKPSAEYLARFREYFWLKHPDLLSQSGLR